MCNPRDPSLGRRTARVWLDLTKRWVAVAVLAGLSSACDSEGKSSTADVSAGDSTPADSASAAFDLNAILYPSPSQSGATARMETDPASWPGKDWHALPFPNDARRAADATLDLNGFPPPRDGEMSGFIETYLAHAKAELRGFSKGD